MAAFTPRQIAVRGQEIAARVLSALDRDGLVARFLRAYAKEQNRPGRTSDLERYGELLETIRREALLVLVLQVETEVPLRLGIRAEGQMDREKAKQHALFHDEFFAALGRGLAWGEKEFDSFRRDLELYRKLYATSPRPLKNPKLGGSPQGPFVDRCGLLLDPSMLDQARRAAGAFEFDLAATASAIVKKAFSRHEPS